MKRIYVLCRNFGYKDGVNRVIANLAHSFRDRLFICVARYDLSAAYKIPESTKVIPVKHWKCESHPFFSLGAWRSFFDIAMWLNKEEGDIILCTHSTDDIKRASIIKLLLIKKNVRISAFVYDKFELIPFEGSSMRARRHFLQVRVIITLLIKFGLVDELLAIDSDISRFVHNVLHTNKVRVVRIGVSHSLVTLSEQNDLTGTERLRLIIRDNCFKIFYMGIMTPKRRFEDLLQALASLVKDGKTATHLFVGGGLDLFPAYAAAIQEMVRELHLSDNVHFLGVLTEEELAFMYKNCDAFVWTGDDQSWGLAPLEAMLFGKPIIISAGNGVSEVLNERVAIVTPPHNPQSIQSAIEALMHDESYGKALGLRAQSFVKERFTFDSTAKELMRLWQLNG